jgi:hypothetical protein
MIREEALKILASYIDFGFRFWLIFSGPNQMPA